MFVSILAVAAACAKERVLGTLVANARSQDITRIESRLNQLEQRFYSIEMSIRGLEQQSRLSSINTVRAERDAEVALLRSEMQSLQRRLAEVECGLARVDERTLTSAAREARQRSKGGAVDPCRLNTNAPLR
jgi:peptidoglycan hydrolase CwlO-like protein